VKVKSGIFRKVRLLLLPPHRRIGDWCDSEAGRGGHPKENVNEIALCGLESSELGGSKVRADRPSSRVLHRVRCCLGTALVTPFVRT
jgi:hypothetical protein